MTTVPPFTLGIEEEYLLVDRETRDLRAAPEGLIAACAEALDGRVTPEFLACQAEVGTAVCATIAEARSDLARLRRTVAEVAADYGLAPIAASCHPFSDWKNQSHTDKARYNDLERALGGVARRMLICGMHVHVGIPNEDLRIELMNHMRYFLPHLLALSASSPFWQGQDTRLASYRLTVFDNLPRTGLPPVFDGWSAYQRACAGLIDLGVIEDTTKIWWDLRPSHRFPTLETRICDVSPRLEDALSIAALVQCIARMLWRLREKNQQWRLYETMHIEENRWRALRYGGSEGLIDWGRREIRPLPELIGDLHGLIAEDADALGCTDEIARLHRMVAEGTSAQRQRDVLEEATGHGLTGRDAMVAVVDHLIAEYHADL